MTPEKKNKKLNGWMAVAACELTSAQNEHLGVHIDNEIEDGENFLRMIIKPHQPLAQEIIEWFADSLQHTIAGTRQQYRVMACGNMNNFSQGNQVLMEQWSYRRHIFIPLQHNGQFVGICVSPQSRTITYYDPSRQWGKMLVTKDAKGKISQLLSEGWAHEKGLEELTVDERNRLIPFCQELVRIEVKKFPESLSEEFDMTTEVPDPPCTWRFEVINQFVRQQSDADSGLFVCLFFEMLVRRSRISLPKQQEGDITMYRKWVAYSVAHARQVQQNRLTIAGNTL